MAMSVTYTTFNGQIVYENRNGTQSFYAPDTLGSTAMLLNTTGTVTDTFSYWPYGEIQEHVGSSVTPFTFVGTLGYYLDILGTLTYVRARHLQPAVCRWLTVDRAWPRQAAYTYVASTPVLRVDPTGLAACSRPCDCSQACNAVISSASNPCGQHVNDPGEHGIVVAFALCCDGQQCACLCPGVQEFQNPIIKKCTRQHEHAHMPTGSCPPGYTGNPKGPPGTGTECAAQMAEIECLWNSCHRGGTIILGNDCDGANNHRCDVCASVKDACKGGKWTPPGWYGEYCSGC